MNANRKADLQRKLALAPVPKPPVGLAERIKREIPKQLRFNADQERQQLSKSVAFNLRVAASILLLVGSAYLALYLLTRVDQQERPAAIAAARRAPAVAAEPAASPAPPPPAKLGKNKPKRQVLIAEAKEEKQEDAAAPPPPAAIEAVSVTRAAKVHSAALNGIELRDQGLDRFARAVPVRESEVRLEQEITRSPVSGKTMLRVSIDKGADISDVDLEIIGARRLATDSATSVYVMEESSAKIRLHYRQDYAEKTIERNVRDVVAWPAASRRTKAAVLAAEWARGGDRGAIIRAAREAGLDELADAVEKR